jgi:hypothetical protein
MQSEWSPSPTEVMVAPQTSKKYPFNLSHLQEKPIFVDPVLPYHPHNSPLSPCFSAAQLKADNGIQHKLICIL